MLTEGWLFLFSTASMFFSASVSNFLVFFSLVAFAPSVNQALLSLQQLHGDAGGGGLGSGLDGGRWLRDPGDSNCFWPSPLSPLKSFTSRPLFWFLSSLYSHNTSSRFKLPSFFSLKITLSPSQYPPKPHTFQFRLSPVSAPALVS